MPSKSQSQMRLMAAAAHSPAFAKKAGVSQSVAKEFNNADTGTKMKSLPKKVKKADGGPIKLPSTPNISKPTDSLSTPRPTSASSSDGRKPLLGEQMGQPKKNFLGIDSRKYKKGGMVAAKPIKRASGRGR